MLFMATEYIIMITVSFLILATSVSLLYMFANLARFYLFFFQKTTFDSLISIYQVYAGVFEYSIDEYSVSYRIVKQYSLIHSKTPKQKFCDSFCFLFYCSNLKSTCNIAKTYLQSVLADGQWSLAKNMCTEMLRACLLHQAHHVA